MWGETSDTVRQLKQRLAVLLVRENTSMITARAPTVTMEAILNAAIYNGDKTRHR